MLQRFRLELNFLVLALFYAWAWWRGNLISQLLLAVFLIVLAAILLVRWGRRLVWRLRDRLIFAYLFTAVVPILAISAVALWVAKEIGGQVAVYIVNNELERRTNALSITAQNLAQTPADRRSFMIDRMTTRLRERFPGLTIIEDENTPSLADGAAGVVVKDRLLYIWAVAGNPAAERRVRVTLLAPLTRNWMASLAPGLGPVSIIDFDRSGVPAGGEFRLHPPPAGAAEDDAEPVAIPSPANRFDLEVRWATPVTATLFDNPTSSRAALLGVRTRLSAVMRALFSLERETPLKTYLGVLLGVLLFVAAISLYIGVSVSTMITGAFNDLYEGTQRIMRGDFSHRIAAKGNDQIAELSSSFNRMTENIENLLAVAKEKERMDTELEIARKVQEQLFPRQVPPLKNLELKAVCQPARMVSGDYYDYQPIAGEPGKFALVLADVAGKGASAALLMASLQACVRLQVGDGDGSRGACHTAELVSRTNKQLHASTSAEKYATFFLAVYDDQTGVVTYTNAGHLPPILIRNGQATLLDVNGMVVGAFSFARYGESRLQLEPGDLLVGYTDGVTEPENEFGEMFGEQRLIEVLLANAGKSSDEIIAAVTEQVRKFTGSPELQDDLTLVLARRRAA